MFGKRINLNQYHEVDEVEHNLLGYVKLIKIFIRHLWYCNTDKGDSRFH